MAKRRNVVSETEKMTNKIFVGILFGLLISAVIDWARSLDFTIFAVPASIVIIGLLILKLRN